MKEYYIKIIRNDYEHIIPASRSCIESARFAHEFTRFVSERFPDDTIYVALFSDYKLVYAADYENGDICGIISLECETLDSRLLKL